MYIVVAVVSFMAFGMIEVVAILRQQRTKKTGKQPLFMHTVQSDCSADMTSLQ